MRKVIAAAFVLAAALLPIGIATPAQAVAALAPGSCGTHSTLTANCANLPILVEAGIISGGSAAAATGGTAAVVGAGAMGTTGFVTVLGATGAAAALGFMKLGGLDSGLFIETDPDAEVGVARPAGWNVSSYVERLTFSGYFADVRSTAVSSVSPDYGANGAYTFVVHYELIGTNYPSGSSCRTVYLSYVAPQLFAANGTYIGGPAVSTPEAGKLAPNDYFKVGNCSGSVNRGTSVTMTYTGSFSSTFGFGAFRVIRNSAYPSGNAPSTWPDDWSRHYYFPVGHSKHQPGESLGYHGTIRTALTCKLNSVAAPSIVYESARVDVEPGGRLPVPPATCPSGQYAAGLVVEFMADGSSSWTSLGTATAPDVVLDFPSEYPDCFGGGAATCWLQLEIKAGATWQSCGANAIYCPEWVRQWQDDPDLYRCRYGPYSVPMDRCSAFRKPGTLLPNSTPSTTPGGAPTPVPPTAPVPESLPNPVRDDSTGEPLSTPPWIDVSGDSMPESDTRECWPSGWGVLNPFSWVLMPLQCAFVPRQSVVQAAALSVHSAWTNSPPGAILQAVGSWEFQPPASDCSGILIDVWFLGDPFRILQACPGDMLADMAMWARIFGAFTITVYGVVAISRHVGGIIGYGGIGSSGGPS